MPIMDHKKATQTELTETFWNILDALLQTGKEQVASSAFRLLMSYLFLDSYQKHSPYSNQLLQAVQDTRIDQSWGSVMMAYRCGQFELARKCFEYAIEKYSRYVIDSNRKRDSKPASS